MASEPTRSILNEDVLPHRPRVARETRRLLMTAVLAVLALWVLARIRFPDRPVTPNPVTPLLSQLTGTPNFSDLAVAVEDVRGRLGSSLVAVTPADVRIVGAQRLDRVPAIRLRDDLAIAVLDPAGPRDAGRPPAVVALDRLTGLAVIRVEKDPRGSVPDVWLPQRLERPRYLITSSSSPADVSLRPTFVGALTPVETPGWSGPVWALAADTDVSPGAFLFTDEGELVGAVTRYDGGLAVVPGSTLVGSAEELLRTPRKDPPVDLGIDVQALTPQLALVSGAEAGVVVTWVDPRSNASDVLRPGDVIKTVDNASVTTTNQWRVYLARLMPADTVVLGVVRGGASRDIQLKAIAPSDPGPALLGLRMRRIQGSGVEVLSVDPGSASDVAGVEAGDVITTIGDIASPTAAQIRSAFAAVKRGDVVIAALTRGAEHRVVTLQR